MENTERRLKLGQAIRQTREAQGISQHRLAYMLGFASHSYVNNIENGRTSVGFDSLCHIADVLNVAVADLLADV